MTAKEGSVFDAILQLFWGRSKAGMDIWYLLRRKCLFMYSEENLKYFNSLTSFKKTLYLEVVRDPHSGNKRKFHFYQTK